MLIFVATVFYFTQPSLRLWVDINPALLLRPRIVGRCITPIRSARTLHLTRRIVSKVRCQVVPRRIVLCCCDTCWVLPWFWQQKNSNENIKSNRPNSAGMQNWLPIKSNPTVGLKIKWICYDFLTNITSNSLEKQAVNSTRCWSTAFLLRSFAVQTTC